ncbi:LacI family transcriptional regulator [Alteromonas sp. BL110]|uniref:substrate-binding domain-containing protein n=1 Tax=unclassified Alteromonas TaxID=2614992 RepID=UPI00044977B9|nr:MULTISPECIES: substrate-binding domain-containing protein [unclassified Alteromonas]AXT39253.1 LacI family transcriptional regulator [Alteromonas sp. BL110]MBT3135031.1 substrate-binding domain-containing protein [Alteromonas sp. ALT199]RKM82264.1 LacI family transcriptional regulator [Alteromonas sp. BL110]
MNKTKVRLVDVATKAGVSKSTASQFLNGRFDFMSLDTRLRLQKAVEELNYVPNNIARSLKTNKTRTLGVIVRDIASYYTSQAIRGMDDYCKKHGYDLFIYNSDFDPATEKSALTTLCQLNVDGVIIASCGNNAKLIEDISKNTVPVVQFQLEHDDCDTGIVVADYKRASFEATEYLIELGHKDICFVTQQFETVKSRQEKYQGFVDAHNKHNLPVKEELILHWSRTEGLAASPVELLKSDLSPTAFFTQQIAITVDVLKALEQANINIPDDVSLLGFEEIPMAEFFRVPVTVVRQQPYEIGSEAASMLLNKIKSGKAFNTRTLVPCELVLRESCSTAKGIAKF